MRFFRKLAGFFRSRRGGIAVFLVVILLTAVGFWWQRNQAPLLWSDIREGDGLVLSLAAGKDSLGNEIVVAGGYFRTDASGRDLRILCYDSADGRVRWEVREDKALPNHITTKPIISIDPAGDALVGWQTDEAQPGVSKTVSKYAGIDGHLLWNWSLKNSDIESYMTAIPVASESGALWVSGIREISGADRRFIAALDTKTGVLLWEHDLNASDGPCQSPAQIHHLKDGGAMVVIPPQDGSGEFPWLIQHRSGVDGGVRWQHEILRENDGFLRGLGGLVDQANGQIVISNESLTSRQQHVDITAFDLTSGAERWHIRDIIPDMSFGQYGPSQGHRSRYGYGSGSVTLGQNGGIEFWGIHRKKTTRTQWWRWRMDHGIPYPKQDSEHTEQPLRVTLSPIDGSIRKSELFARPREHVVASLARPGGSPEVLIIREFYYRKPSNQPDLVPWRAELITHQSRLFLPSRVPAGMITTNDFPEHAALTPSGRLVIGGDHAADKRQWHIRVW